MYNIYISIKIYYYISDATIVYIPKTINRNQWLNSDYKSRFLMIHRFSLHLQFPSGVFDHKTEKSSKLMMATSNGCKVASGKWMMVVGLCSLRGPAWNHDSHQVREVQWKQKRKVHGTSESHGPTDTAVGNYGAFVASNPIKIYLHQFHTALDCVLMVLVNVIVIINHFISV